MAVLPTSAKDRFKDGKGKGKSKGFKGGKGKGKWYSQQLKNFVEWLNITGLADKDKISADELPDYLDKERDRFGSVWIATVSVILRLMR